MHAMLASRTRSFWALFWLLVTWTTYLFSDCCFLDPTVPQTILDRACLAAQLSAPSVIPLVILYMRRVRKITRQQHPLELFWVVVPAMLFSVALTLYITIGEDQTAVIQDAIRTGDRQFIQAWKGTSSYLYYIVTGVVYRVVLAAEFVWLAVYIIHVAVREKFGFRNIYRHMFKGEPIKVIELVTLPILVIYIAVLIRMLVLKEYVPQNEALIYIYCAIITVFTFYLSFVGLAAAKRTITINEVRHMMRYNYSPETQAQDTEAMLYELLDEVEDDALRRLQDKLSEDLHIEEFRSDTQFVERPAVAEKIFNAVADSWGEDELLNRFQTLMRDEMLFLQPRLSLDDVADKLQTNKFTVSKLVNNAYNLGFPELINTLRIDYAEQYLLNHRDARQNEVAQQCGFLSASSFNTIFKKITGVTPKVWVAAKDRLEQ